MFKIRHTLALTLLCYAAAPAVAAPYNFDVLYSGGGNAVLAAGSDDPLTTTMVAGDSFVYTLSAQGGAEWKVINGSSIFPLFALPVAEDGTRVGDFTLSLLNNGGNVYTYSELGASNSFVHLGTNTVTLAAGLEFDTISLSYTVNSANAGSTPTSLLPWPGLAPEQYSPDSITYTQAQAVPEPSTYGLMALGLGVVGFAARRRASKANA